MRRPLVGRWLNVLTSLLLLPRLYCDEELTPLARTYLEAFQTMFPRIDVKATKIFDFVENPENVKKLILMNFLECRNRQLDRKGSKVKRAVKSAYQMVAVPLDEYSTPLPTKPNTDFQYGYVDKSFYDKYNMTSSELAISREGWDYSPYFPPNETTTQFIWPSWNYGGHVPVAFWKDWTGHEMDMEQSTYRIPDNENGYTDADLLKITSFGDLYNAFWDTVYSIPHRCENYTSVWKCLQGDEETNPNFIDSLNDPVDK